MRRKRSMLMVLAIAAVMAILLAACGTSDDSDTGDAGDSGTDAVVGQCAEDAPDCQDTIVLGGDTGGGAASTCPEGTVDCNDTPGALTDDPLPPNDDVSAPSGFVVGGGISVEEALAYEGSEVVAVGAFFVSTDGEARLCDALAESYPPQCGGASIVITNPEDFPTEAPLVEEGSTQWLDSPITVFGYVTDGELTLAPNVTG